MSTLFFQAAEGAGEEASGRLSDTAREDLSRELEDLDRRMREEKRALSRIMRKQGNLIEKLEALKAQLVRSRARIKKLIREQGILEAESAELLKKMSELERSAGKKREAMKKRMRARYRFGRRETLAVLFNSGSVSEYSRRRKYLEALYLADMKKIREYGILIDEWSKARERLKVKQGSLVSLERVLNTQQEQLESERRSRQAMLRSIREERSAHEAMLEELKASASRLRGVIAEIDRRSMESEVEGPGEDAEVSAFAGLRGSLCYPAPGQVTIGFGKQVHPQFNTETMHNGIEIGAADGAPVRSVFKGVVRFAEWFRGYGNLVIVDHGAGYYTIYAHLSRIRVSVGQEVRRGGLVGNVGDTGSLSGPSLYFEIRHHQKPLNPAAWLANCAA
jgi:septal ring factor EnvC (AmiA/AmiB activator)